MKLKVLNPLHDGTSVYAEHYPCLNDALVQDLQDYKSQSSNTLKCGEKFHFQCIHWGSTTKYNSLFITNTQLQVLDSDECCWKDCSNLDLVHLLRNQLRVLPRKLMEHSLRMLSLSYNDFNDFPDVILSIRTLQNLNMIRNQLTLLPSNLSLLTSLTNLHLGSNHIIYLPDSFDGLSNLVVLTLDHNQLTSLPPTFCHLSQLKILHLNNNNFRAFPLELLNLSSLCELKLSCNRIQYFPPEAEEFCRHLSHSNFSDRYSCRPYSNPIQVLVVGESNSGKTSLMHALCENDHVNPNYQKKEYQTVGIDHYHYYGKNSELSLWDFAGERSYAMMNGIFLARAAIVWIVFNLGEFKCKMNIYEKVLGGWIRKIVSYFEPEAELPNIWIIGTHRDKCNDSDLRDKESFIKECLLNSKTISQSSLGRDLLKQRKVFFLSNTFKFSGQDDLIRTVEQLDIESSHCDNEEQLLQWSMEEYKLHLRAAEMIRNKQMPMIAYEDLRDLIAVNDKEKFIDYLNGTGEIFILRLNTLDGKKMDQVFLNTKWFIYILKQVFRHDLEQYILHLLTDRFDPEAVDSIKKHLKMGEVNKATLKLLWKSLNLIHIEALIQILCDYSLFYLDPTGEFYVVPWLMKNNTIPCLQNIFAASTSIILNFTSDYIDPHFYEEILFLCDRQDYERQSWSTYHSVTTNYELYVVCEQDLTRIPEGYMYDRIVFYIAATKGCVDYPSLWKVVYSSIIQKVNILLKSKKQYLHKAFPTYVECPQCNSHGEATPQLFSWDNLSKERSDFVICKCCRTQGREGKISMAKLFPRNDFNLQSVCQAVKEVYWYSLGVELGISKHTLDEIEKHFAHEDNDRKATEMIGKWLSADNSSWSKLCEALHALEYNKLELDIRNQYLN